MREVILAQNLEDREKALDKLFPYQRDDFKGMFQAAGLYCLHSSFYIQSFSG